MPRATWNGHLRFREVACGGRGARFLWTLQVAPRGVLAIRRPRARDRFRGRDITDHGDWLPWLEAEFAWSRQTADN